MNTNNDISLRDYVDKQFELLRESIATALAAVDKEATKNANAYDKRFDSVNEFRATLADNARLQMPRAEAELALKQLSDRIDINTTTIRVRESKGAGMQVLWGYIIGAVGVALAIVAFFHK